MFTLVLFSVLPGFSDSLSRVVSEALTSWLQTFDLTVLGTPPEDNRKLGNLWTHPLAFRKRLFVQDRTCFFFALKSTHVLDFYSLLVSTATHYLLLRSSNNKKTTGGRDSINFKTTHSDKQCSENKSARPGRLSLSPPPSATPGHLPGADNGCAPLRALYWDDGWGHLPHSRPCLLRPRANVCSPLKRINGNSYKW